MTPAIPTVSILPADTFLAPYIEGVEEPWRRVADLTGEMLVMVAADADEARALGAEATSASAARRGAALIVPAGTDIDTAELRAALRCPLLTLRTGWIIGTGMTGWPRTLVNQIGRGTLWAIDDTDAVRPVVHALDVARIVRHLIARDADLELDDGSRTTVAALSEALARRIDRRTLMHTTLAKARSRSRWLGLLGDYTSLNRRQIDMTVTACPQLDTAWLDDLPADLRPRRVTDYLTNHQYGDDDI